MKVHKRLTSNSLKKTIKSTIEQSKNLIQDRIQQIRRSYPYTNTDELPGLSVSLLAGDPSDLYSTKDTNFDKKMVIDDVSKLALL